MRPALGDKEIFRLSFRISLFVRRGIETLHAEKLADRLATRDYERDDRRLCLECKHMKRARVCTHRLPMSIEQLARCHRFEFQTPE